MKQKRAWKGCLWAFVAAVTAVASACTTDAPEGPKKDASAPETAAPRPSQPEGWDRDIALASAKDENDADDVVEVSLRASITNVSLGDGTTLPLWTYNGLVPGPVVRARQGQTLRVHLENALPEATTIHHHGVRVPNAMDGTEMVQTAVPPGGTFTYSFSLPDEGTYWYHPHVHSSAQVGYGLYGPLVVDAKEPDGLPESLPIVLSDLSVDEQGKLADGAADGAFGDFFGREGKYVLTNGKVMPRVIMRKGLAQRWRIVNASRARYFALAFPELVVHRLGGDGGRMSAPEPIRSYLLVPGERLDLFVVATGNPGTETSVMRQSYDRFGTESGSGGTPLFRVAVSDDAPVPAESPPAKLATIETLSVEGKTPRMIELSEVPKGNPTAFGIDGKTGADIGVFHAKAGTRERWIVENATNMDHPFHLHGFFFQVLAMNGVPRTTREWKDTVNLRPHDRVEFIADFDRRPGMWMFHCHILDHTDHGMMAMLHVE
ncbi:MAG: multicopper oxidase family protein [Polyangiaceae bacterium]